MFEVLEDETELLQGSVLLGAGATSFTTTLPEPSGATDTWRLRVRVQLGGEFPCVAEDTLGFIHRVPICVDFTLVETVHTPTSSTIIWSEYPGAMGYMMSVLDETGETMIPPFPLLLPPDQLSYVLEGLPPGNYLVRVGPWMEATFCEEELALTFEQGQFPCLIRTNRADVRARVGPGLDHAAFAFLTAGVEYPVIGQAFDEAGNLWWQIDKSFIPGGEAALSLWVLASEVETVGDCTQVPPGGVPPEVTQGRSARRTAGRVALRGSGCRAARATRAGTRPTSASLRQGLPVGSATCAPAQCQHQRGAGNVAVLLRPAWVVTEPTLSACWAVKYRECHGHALVFRSAAQFRAAALDRSLQPGCTITPPFSNIG